LGNVFVPRRVDYFLRPDIRVVPANAGIHTPCTLGLATEVETCASHQRQGLWVPAGACHRAARCADPVAGTTKRGRVRTQRIASDSIFKEPRKPRAVIPGWSAGPDLRCAIAHRGISRFRVRCFASPRNDGERDKRNLEALRKLGWRVAIVWECSVKDEGADAIAKKVAAWLRSGGPFKEISSRSARAASRSVSKKKT